VLSLLREFHRQLDWNIAVERPLSVTGSGSSNSGDQSQTSNSPGGVNHDVIEQCRHYSAVTGQRRRWSATAWWRSPPRRSLSTQPRIIHRYSFSSHRRAFFTALLSLTACVTLSNLTLVGGAA